jgi:hypothetical protein
MHTLFTSLRHFCSRCTLLWWPEEVEDCKCFAVRWTHGQQSRHCFRGCPEVSASQLTCLSWTCRNSSDQSPASHRGGTGSSPGQVTWELWWTKRHWGRFPLSTSALLSKHSTDCSTVIIIQLPGLVQWGSYSGLCCTPPRKRIKELYCACPNEAPACHWKFLLLSGYKDSY